MAEIPKKKKEGILLLIISLCSVAFVAAVVLSIFAAITEKPIKQAITNTTLSTFKKLQPDFDNEPLESRVVAELVNNKWVINKKITAKIEVPAASNVVIFYPAKVDGKLKSFFVQATSPFGYAGNVTALAAIDLDGRVINVDVTQSNETAGLGTNVYSREVRKTIWGIFKGEYKDSGNKLTPNPVMDFFVGKEYVPDNKHKLAKMIHSYIIPESKWKVEKDGGDFKYITGATITSRTVTDAVKRMLMAYYQNEKKLLKMCK